MKYLKRFIIFVFILSSLAAALSVSGSAVFTGDDRIVIVLDPGHGGKDPGSAGIRDEAYYNLEVANYVKAALEANGNFVVHMTRSTAGEYLTLAERLYFADTVNADIAISLHFNSSTNTSMGGVEVYGSVIDKFYLGDLGKKIGSGVAAAAGINNRGIFRKYDYGSTLYYWSEEYQWDIPGDKSVGGVSDYYGVITWGAKFGIPSLIVEHAYISNPTERKLAEDEGILKKMGEADAAAIIDYYTNHTHSYGAETVDAPVTCFSAGKKSVHCTICGHRKNVTSIAASPDPSKHLWIPDGESVPASCETDGHAKLICRYTSNLNDKGCTQFEVHRTDSVTPALGHDYAVTYSKEVTHTEDGVTEWKCTRCGDSYSETVAAEGHTYGLISHADPSCAENGYDVYSCNVCGDSYTDVIPMTGHSFEVTGRTDPTCEESGSESRLCSVCGFEETLVLDALGHDPETVSEVAATCTDDGFRDTKCKVCGKTEHTVLEKLGHTYETLSKLDPGCETAGEMRRRCVSCGIEETVISDPAGHDWQIESKTEPDCTNAGEIKKKCSVCGALDAEIIPASGHDFVEKEEVKSPGLFRDGSAEFVCTKNPSHTEIRPIRDLTIYEYIGKYHKIFIAAAALAALILIFLIVIIARLYLHRPTHALPRSARKAGNNVKSGDKEKTPETVGTTAAAEAVGATAAAEAVGATAAAEVVGATAAAEETGDKSKIPENAKP